MTSEKKNAERCPDQLEVLSFRLGGTPMAADLRQILRVQAHENSRIDGLPANARASKVLVLRGKGDRRSLVIDQPGDIHSVPIHSIQPMPALIRACANTRPYWGAVLFDGSPVLLVDLDLLVPG